MASSSVRKQRWREKHPDRDRKRRDKDNENRRYARALNKSKGKEGTKLKCSKKKCNKKGEVHHKDSKKDGKKEVVCRQHHQVEHNKRGDGPGSKGHDRKNEASHGGALIHHPSHDIQKKLNELAGLVHSKEKPVILKSDNNGSYSAK